MVVLGLWPHNCSNELSDYARAVSLRECRRAAAEWKVTMMRIWLSMSLCLATPALVFGQQQQPTPKEGETLPLPLVSPRAIQPGTIDPLTPSEKARMALKDTFGVGALVNRAVLAGINQWMNHPSEWGGGMDAYGKRYASRWARMAVRNSIELGADLAFKTDPRYDRCDCSGFRPRTGHALKRVFVARRDDG
jgi:hypothetical protein